MFSLYILVHAYLKYCNAKEKTIKNVMKSVFWNSSHNLWVDDNDICTILGYYEFLFENANVPDIVSIASIGFILDPIKKNYT